MNRNYKGRGADSFMTEIKVSIVIPVYNSEKFLAKCLDSVVGQTMKEKEIIVVNDGSTDRSQQIIDDYADRYTDIVRVTQENAGQGAARNRALYLARGEYVAFVDSDDYIDRNALEILYTEARGEQCDVVLFNWNKVDVGGHVLEYRDHSRFDNRLFHRDGIVREFLINNQALIEGFSWNKFIKRDLFETFHIRYPNLKFEDIPTMFQILTKTGKCKYLNKTLYHYVSNEDSTVHSMNESNVRDFVVAINMIGDILAEENIDRLFEKEYFVYKSNHLLREYGRSYGTVQSSEELLKLFKKNLGQITWKQCLASSKDLKLMGKLFFYKIGLLHLFIFFYHKLKPIH